MVDIHVQLKEEVTEANKLSIIYTPDQRQVLEPGHEYTFIFDNIILCEHLQPGQERGIFVRPDKSNEQ